MLVLREKPPTLVGLILGVYYFISFFALVEFFLIFFIHSTLLDIIKIVTFTNVALFFSLIIYSRKEFVKNGITP